MSEEERRVESEIIRKKFRNAILLTSTFFLVEAIGGYLCKSLAIWSDASHLLSDVISLAISLGASHLAERPKDPRRSTFGLRRVESLAALLSMVFLIGLTLSLIAFSIWRLVSGNTGDIDGRIMSGVSLSGIFVNLGLVAILGEHHHVGLIPSASNTPSTNNNNNNNNVTLANPNDGLNIELPARFSTTYVPVNQGDGQDEDDLETLRQSTRVSFDVDDDANEKNKGKKLSRLVMGNVNLQATYLHVLGDLLQSIGIFIAALFIWIWPRSAYWIDPMCTTLFSSLVMMTTVPVVRTSLSVLLLQVPPSLDGVCIRQELESRRNRLDSSFIHNKATI